MTTNTICLSCFLIRYSIVCPSSALSSLLLAPLSYSLAFFCSLLPCFDFSCHTPCIIIIVFYCPFIPYRDPVLSGLLLPSLTWSCLFHALSCLVLSSTAISCLVLSSTAISSCSALHLPALTYLSLRYRVALE